MLKLRKIAIKSFSILLVLASFILGACQSTRISNGKKEKPIVIYPSPPDTAKIQFLTRLSSTLDLGKKQSFFSKFLLGEGKPKAMVKPYGISIYKGKIYVCDNYGGGMEIIDLEKKDMSFFNPSGKGKLKIPINCFVDQNGYLYVADAGRLEVVVYDENGNYLRSFGGREKFKPADVFVYKNKIFVANIANGKINVYAADSTNKFLYAFPEVEPGSAGYLCMPTNIAINNDLLYASDFGCSSIKVYTTDGVIKDTIGSQGDNPGQFAKVKGIAVDKESNIYAVDAAFENVQVFNKDGKLLIVFGGHYVGPGDMIIPAKVMIDYDNLEYFSQYVDHAYDLKYLIFVTNQYGPDLINVYGRVELKPKM